MPEDEREERGIHDLLRSLDHPPPGITADDVIRRARRSRAPARRLAAGLAAAIGLAGVAYAVPGSPVRDWVRAVIPGDTPAGRFADDPSTPAPVGGSGAGMVFDPVDSLVVRFPSSSGGHLRIELTEGTEIVARMRAGEGRFTSRPNELVVRLSATDTLELLVPRTAASVEVRVGDRSLFRNSGGVLRTPMDSDGEGRYGVDLDGGTP